ncbi:zinc finger, CCHC-type containing protein [Tanacetum coccineum]
MKSDEKKLEDILIVWEFPKVFPDDLTGLPPLRQTEFHFPHSGGSVVPEKVIEEVVQQPEPELRKSKRHRTTKDFRPEFELYLIEGTRDLISDQHSYCFNVDDDPKTFDEATKSQDVAFLKEAINDEMDSIMGNNTWVLADLPPGCKPLGYKWIFKRKLKVDGTVEKFKARLMDVQTTFLNGELKEEVYMNQPQGFIMPGNENKVDLTKEFLSSRFSMKDMGEADVILVLKDTNEKKMLIMGQALNLNLSIHKASKKQTCITGSIMESEFVSLAAAGKEAEWLKNLLLEIPLWVKPIAPISICYDSAATYGKGHIARL